MQMFKRPAAALMFSVVTWLVLACDRTITPTEPQVGGARTTAAIVTALSADLVVDDDRVQCADADHTTIQDAINAASAGHVIFVCPGVYPENAPGKLEVNKTVTLAGAQNGVDARSRLAGMPESIIADVVGTSVSASNVVIDGFTVRNATQAVETPFGLWLNPGINGPQILNNIIEDNTIGISLANAGASQAVIRHNWIRNNNAPGHNTNGTGIFTDEVYGGQVVRNVLIEENLFTGHTSTGAGILTFNTAFTSGGVFGLEVRRNTFRQNNRAFLLFNTHSSTFDGNTISGSTTQDQSDFRILDNNTDLIFTKNDLSDGIGHAISVRIDFGLPSSNLQFHENNFERYALTGLTVEPGAYVGTLNAECNWWNSSTGPTASGNPNGTGEEVVGNADYTPWLVARAPGGACTGGGTTPPPNQPPVASFTHSCTALTCSFTSTSSDPDGSIASYNWTFGDGTPAATSQNPSHTYATGGTYTVTLTVTDNQGATNSRSQSVTVTKQNSAPVASFTHSCSGLTCSFTSTSSDSDGSISSYRWTFGDGTPAATTQNASHAYAAAGTYTVTLTVTDNQGATNATSKSVTVTQPNSAPVVDAGPDQTALTGLLFSFNWSFSDANNNGPWSYTIDWGDGHKTTGTKTSQGTFSAGHTYITILPRSFTIRVTVKDAAGATTSDTKIVRVLLL
jgi:PKD repeat protein